MEESSFLHKMQSVRSKKVQIDNAFACRTPCSYTGTARFCVFSFVSMINFGIVYRPLQTQLIYFGVVAAPK